MEKIVYKLVEKHIGGITMSAAVSKAKSFNARGITATISFLSDAPMERAKANYITATYMQLVRQIARMGVKGRIHIPMEQIGSGISEDVALANIGKINKTCMHYKVFGWYEIVDLEAEKGIAERLSKMENSGIAFQNVQDAREYIRSHRGVRNIKVSLKNGNGAEMHEEKDDDKRLNLSQELGFVLGKARDVTLLLDDSALSEFIAGDKKRKSVELEFYLGNDKLLNKALKNGFRTSVYMPFGKEWIKYAVNLVPQGRMKGFAEKLLMPGSGAADISVLPEFADD